MVKQRNSKQNKILCYKGEMKVHNNNFQYLNNISESFSTKFINGLFLDKKWKYTYSSSFAQIASATLSIISDPSKNTESQIFKTVWLGRHVANRVRNHCIVKTFVSGGSYPPETEKEENNHLVSSAYPNTKMDRVQNCSVIPNHIIVFNFSFLQIQKAKSNHIHGMPFFNL